MNIAQVYQNVLFWYFMESSLTLKYAEMLFKRWEISWVCAALAEFNEFTQVHIKLAETIIYMLIHLMFDPNNCYPFNSPI